jgi:hypothetical protein
VLTKVPGAEPAESAAVEPEPASKVQ